MAKSSAPKTKTINRSSETGRIVTKDYAKKHPKTTETEKVRIPPKKKP